MPNGAHNVGLIPLLVEGILHCLAVYRQRLVVCSPGLIPCIEPPIQHPRLNAYQAISNHRFARNDIASVLTPAVKTFACLRPQLIGPIGDRFVAAHAAQDRARRDAQHRRQPMTLPLAAARIGNGLETLRQQAHLCGIEHDLGVSC